MKIHSLRAVLFRADGWIEKWTHFQAGGKTDML